ncbi:putative metalloprotease CJM1_0395 family protein [uncultured Vibrio sp.]|uniref:putative metalloprotease CJM1_0395 family protein n=1 Tax=uncultured Vibrio sp. TaxID=114054 RepID=UPI002AA954D8|nr:putative metalloprotease CJM1_0395 family protein [uncultured Vibrio sp.]
MLASSSSLNSSQLAFYNRSGQALSLFRSEPAQRVVSMPKSTSGEEQESGDTVSLSREGLEKSRQSNETPVPAEDETASEPSAESKQADGQSVSPTALTPEEKRMVQELKQRDQEVKTHEMAHLAAAGQYAAGGASYSYQQGPDGRRYAIGGEVPIDVSEEKTPEETIQKMQAIKRAAMAPAEPSNADRSVAANASAMESRARQELQSEKTTPAQEQSATDAAAFEEDNVLAAPLSPDEQQANSSIDVMA